MSCVPCAIPTGGSGHSHSEHSHNHEHGHQHGHDEIKSSGHSHGHSIEDLSVGLAVLGIILTIRLSSFTCKICSSVVLRLQASSGAIPTPIFVCIQILNINCFEINCFNLHPHCCSFAPCCCIFVVFQETPCASLRLH